MKTKGLFIFIFINLFKFSEAQYSQWLNVTQGFKNEYSTSISVDNNGNTFQVGYFDSIVDFDNTAGVLNYGSTGDRDIYIRKLNASGDFVWAKKIGSKGYDAGTRILMTGANSIEITGIYSDTIDLDPGAGVDIHYAIWSKPRLFKLVLDTNGNYQSALDFGNGTGYLTTISKNNHHYFTGRIYDTVDIDFTSGTQLLYPITGQNINFIAKYDNAYNLIWFKSYATTNGFGITFIDIDSKDNIIYGGGFNGTEDFNPSASVVYNLSPFTTNKYSFFISKLNASGDFVYAKAFQSNNSNNDRMLYGKVLSNDNTVLTCSFVDSIDINPDSVAQNMRYAPSGGIIESLIIGLDSNGNYLYGDKFGYSPSGAALSIVSSLNKDVNDNFYIGGIFIGTADMNMSTSAASNYTHQGSQYDFFIVKYDVNGNYKWTKQIDVNRVSSIGTSDDYIRVNQVVLGPDQNIYATGSFFGVTANFEVSDTSLTTTPPNQKYEAFVLKFYQSATPLYIDLIEFKVNRLVENNYNQIHWKYQTDENCYQFNLLKSDDAIHWKSIHKNIVIKNSLESLFYIDSFLNKDISYYRLDILKNDTKHKSSEIIVVKNSLNHQSSKFWYNNKKIYSNIKNKKIEIYDMKGVNVFEGIIIDDYIDISKLKSQQLFILHSEGFSYKFYLE